MRTPETVRVIEIRAPVGVIPATLNDTKLAGLIAAVLPLTVAAHRWGDEIYFDIPVSAPNEQPTRSVEVGDLGFWPDGPSLCIFFGATPASRGREPRPASDITIVGHTDAPPEALRAIEAGMTLELVPAPSAGSSGQGRRASPHR